MNAAFLMVAYLSSYGGPSGTSWSTMIEALAVHLLVWVLPIVVLAWVVYSLLRLPLRRNQRLSLFLDLIEATIKDGKKVEDTLAHLSMSHDKTLGSGFHLLGVYLMDGFKLTEALEMLPRFMPQQMLEMLRIGERVGDLGKVLPSCRRLIGESSSRSSAAQNYLVVLAFVLNPLALLLLLFTTRILFGRFAMIVRETETSATPWLFQFVYDHRWAVGFAQWGLTALACLGVVVCCISPRLFPSSVGFLGRVRDRFEFQLQWRRSRLVRDFSAMLALLLDAGVPETDALLAAGQSTANSVLQRRAEVAADRLRQGCALPEALARFDEAGEFRWRLANAAQGGTGFLETLGGWHESLEAKAYRQEQAAAHVTTTALVLFNGTIVGLVVVGLMQSLVCIIQEGVLW